MDNAYKQIARGSSLLGRYRVFLGDDHLILLEQFFFMQYYFRFYFRDIQGMMACQTGHFRAALLLFIFGIMMVIGGVLPQIQGRTISPGNWVMIVTFSILAFFSFIQVIRGNTYRIDIVTKVQQKRFKWTMNRRQWSTLRDIVVPLIEAGQERPVSTSFPLPIAYEQLDSPAAMQTPPGA